MRATVTNFNIAPDKAALSRVNDSLSTLQQSRDLRTRDAETTLRKLSRQLATLSSQHRETIASHDGGRHTSEIVQLDTRKFRIAKKASELEVENERLEAELERLKNRLADLEEQGVEGDENARRTREADDPTMYVDTKIPRRLLNDLLTLLPDYDFGYIAHSVSPWSRTRQVTTQRLSLGIPTRAMSISSTLTQNSQSHFMPTTFGRRSRVDFELATFDEC